MAQAKLGQPCSRSASIPAKLGRIWQTLSRLRPNRRDLDQHRPNSGPICPRFRRNRSPPDFHQIWCEQDRSMLGDSGGASLADLGQHRRTRNNMPHTTRYDALWRKTLIPTSGLEQSDVVQVGWRCHWPNGATEESASEFAQPDIVRVGWRCHCSQGIKHMCLGPAPSTRTLLPTLESTCPRAQRAVPLGSSRTSPTLLVSSVFLATTCPVVVAILPCSPSSSRCAPSRTASSSPTLRKNRGAATRQGRFACPLRARFHPCRAGVRTASAPLTTHGRCSVRPPRENPIADPA